MTSVALVEPQVAANWRMARERRQAGRRGALPALLGSICLLVASCSADRPAGSGGDGAGPATDGGSAEITLAAALRGQHYVLAAGRLIPTTELELATVAAAAELRPWTVQSRVVASRAVDGATYLAVNGWGFVRIGDLQADQGEGGPFEYFYAPELFSQRTLTHLFEWDGEIAGHVYVNHLLAERAVADEIAERGNLVRLSGGELRSVASPHKAVGPAWQSVSVAQVAPNEAMLEWKLEDRRGIHFQYTQLTLGQGDAREVAVSRDLFLRGYRFRGVSDPDVPAPLRGLASDIIAAGRSGGVQPSAYHFLLRDATAAASRLRYQPDGATQLHTVPVVAGGGGYLALLEEGGVLNATPPLPTVLHLPPLPGGLRYVDLHVVVQADGAEWLLAVWEQARFYRVGAAGITLLPLDGGLPSPAIGRG